MTKQDMIDLLATSREHATKLKAFKVAELRAFAEAQSDPKNHEEFPVGSYVYCEWAKAKGIVVHSEKIPGRDSYKIEIRVNVSHKVNTESNDIIRYQG